MQKDIYKKKLENLEIEKRLNEVKATLEIEGLTLSEQGEEIGRLFLKNKITEQEAKRMILKLHEINEI